MLPRVIAIDDDEMFLMAIKTLFRTVRFLGATPVDAGFDARNHPYHVKSGYWEKAHRGIYRLVQFPVEPSMQYATWSLWSCNRKGEPQGVYSHETALSIYELSDLDPA